MDIARDEEHARLDGLADDSLCDRDGSVAWSQFDAEATDAANGSARGDSLRARDRPVSPVELVEGESPPVGVRGARQLASKTFDAEDDRMILSNLANVSEFDAIGESRERERGPRAPTEDVGLEPWEEHEKDDRQPETGDRGDDRRAPEVGGDGIGSRRRISGLGGLHRESVDEQSPGYSRKEHKDERRKEDAVREVRGEDHLKQRQRDQYEF